VKQITIKKIVTSFIIAAFVLVNIASAQNNLVSIQKTVTTPTPFSLGSTVVFKIKVTNTSNSAIDNIVVSDTLRNGYQLINATTNMGVYNGTGVNLPGINGWTWLVGTLQPADSAILLINALYLNDGFHHNIATVIDNSNNQNTTNSDTALFSVGASDPKVEKSVDKHTAEIGDTVTFTVLVTNQGPDAITNIFVSDKLPDCFAMLNATSNQGFYDEVLGIWTVANQNTFPTTLVNGAQAILYIKALCVQDGFCVNTASLFGPFGIDLNPNNNSDTAGVDVGSSTDLSLVKKVDNAKPKFNDDGSETTINFTIEVKNESNKTAKNVVVADTLSTFYRFISSNASIGSYNYATSLWDIGEIQPQQMATLNIKVGLIGRATSGSNKNNSYNNTAQVFKSNRDTDSSPGNNNANEDDQSTVEVKPTHIFISEGISPNADGIADTWTIDNPEEHELIVKIYNRYGEIVFDKSNYKNEFIGKANVGIKLMGDDLPDGTYYYIVEDKTQDFTTNGVLTIKR
jgi:large repetitive protein